MGKTVTTYLIDGDPKGTRYVFIENNVCRMYVIPRTKLDILNDEKLLQGPALYILLGESEDAKPKAYIGQTESFKERVREHDNKKDFWNKVLLFISTSMGGGLTTGSVKYLEHCAIRDAKKTNAYVLDENKQIPKEPYLPEHQKAPIDDFYQDVKFLTSFYGCALFDIPAVSSKVRLFFTKGRGSDAKGIYSDDGFTVLKGSILAGSTVPSFNWAAKREKLLADYAQNTSDGKYELLGDKTFSSPSTAADFCIGSSNNGWIVWKDKDGKTLDAVVRKQL